MFIFLSFAIFLVAVFAIAWYKAKGTDNTETATGYFLAGRGLSWSCNCCNNDTYKSFN